MGGIFTKFALTYGGSFTLKSDKMNKIRPLTIEEYKQLSELVEAVRLYCMSENITTKYRTKKDLHHSVEYKLYKKIQSTKSLLDDLLHKQYPNLTKKGLPELSRVFYGVGDKVVNKYKMPDSDAKK